MELIELKRRMHAQEVYVFDEALAIEQAECLERLYDLGVVPLERRFGQENQEVEPKEGRKRRPFYGVIESPNT